MRLIVRPDAETDIASGHEWYEQQREGLGAEFLGEVSSAIEAIQVRPHSFPIIYGKLRRSLVHRFPYGIFFIAESNAIVVVATLHLARDPRWARARAK